MCGRSKPTRFGLGCFAGGFDPKGKPLADGNRPRACDFCLTRRENSKLAVQSIPLDCKIRVLIGIASRLQENV